MPYFVRSFGTILRAKLLKLVLAGSIALPVTAALTISQAAPVAASVCYYGAWTYDTVSETPVDGARFTGEVKYQIGYSCAGYADSVYIDWFYDSMTFTGQASTTPHWTTEGWVCDPYIPSTAYCATAWGPDFTSYKCTGNCTVYRVDFPRRWFNYDSGMASVSHWANITLNGGVNYTAIHQFLVHRLYHNFCC